MPHDHPQRDDVVRRHTGQREAGVVGEGCREVSNRTGWASRRSVLRDGHGEVLLRYVGVAAGREPEHPTGNAEDGDIPSRWTRAAVLQCRAREAHQGILLARARKRVAENE